MDTSKFDVIIEWDNPEKDKPHFVVCEEYYNKHMKQKGWLISRLHGYICEFCTDTPVGVFSIRISRDNGKYKFTKITKYYKGFMPRYLDKKEFVENDWFSTLFDLLDNIKHN